MDYSLAQAIEVLLFVADSPQSASDLLEQLNSQAEQAEEQDSNEASRTEVDLATVEAELAELTLAYATKDAVWELRKIAGGYQFVTRPQYAQLVKQALLVKDKKRLSRAALEVLSIIAYRQPVTRPEIEYIRGVSSDYALNKLLEKQLVEPNGRADLPGKPLLYQTSRYFLEYFGLSDPTELPSLTELKNEEASLDTDFRTTDTANETQTEPQAAE